MIIQTVVITICSIGLGANSCAFFVLLKSSIDKSTTRIYLTFLAVFDGLVLATQLIFSFSDVINRSIIACKLFWMVRVPVITISCYILVIMTVEKCYVLVNTYKVKPTRKQALKIATTSVVVITLVLGTQLGITHGLVSLPNDGTSGNSSNYVALENNFPMIGNETIICDVLPQHKVYSNRLFSLISLVFTRMVAPIIVIICNLIIIKSLRKHATQVAPLNATSNVNDKRITKVLIIVSLCFALLVIPSSLYMLYILILRSFYDNVAEAEAVDPQSPLYQVVMDCLLINHSINFLLYIMSSKTFRKEAVEAFKSLFNICVRNNQN